MSFQDIKGQDKPIEILKAYLRSGTLTGAYLFIGQEGIGKFLTAHTLARAINCLNSELDPCDKCPACLKMEKNQHPDLHVIAPCESDTLKIEYIRELKKRISLKPYEAKKKVFIINDAHNLTAEAANALLKVLEEPPRDSLIILVTSRPALLFKTIISRCKIIRFSPLGREEVKEILKQDYGLHQNLAHFLAYFCEGRLGEALRLKEVDILREKNRVIDHFALSGSQMQGVADRQAVRGQLNILASWFRDLYLAKAETAPDEFINFDRREDVLRLKRRYTFLELDDALRSISDSLLYLDKNVNVKLLLSSLRAQLWKR